MITYVSKSSFLGDKNKHFTDSKSTKFKYRFLLKDAKRFRNSIPLANWDSLMWNYDKE